MISAKVVKRKDIECRKLPLRRIDMDETVTPESIAEYLKSECTDRWYGEIVESLGLEGKKIKADRCRKIVLAVLEKAMESK
jgi:hypothetical protein